MSTTKNKPFHEQIALITGGATGIGHAFSEGLLARGIGRVVIASRREAALGRAADGLNAKFDGDRVASIVFDIRDRASTEKLVRQIESDFGAIDILINNAGLAVAESIDAISEDGWNQVMETNVRGAMWLSQIVLPKMFAANFGDIVNVSSQAGKHGYADVPSYCASKFALLGLAESIRDEIRRRSANVRVFNLCPGLVDVESDPSGPAKPGYLHVRSLSASLLYALALDRNVELHDLGMTARTL
jgi:3-oxoacyl-[acyl-carrier protein] reductase